MQPGPRSYVEGAVILSAQPRLDNIVGLEVLVLPMQRRRESVPPKPNVAAEFLEEGLEPLIFGLFANFCRGVSATGYFAFQFKGGLYPSRRG